MDSSCCARVSSFDEIVDIVVAGYGAAGATAAIEAARGGARVLLLEKMPDPGGLSILSSGGIRVADDKASALAYLQATCAGRTPLALLDALAHGMATLPEWLREQAVVNGAQISVSRAPGNYPFPGCDALGYVEVASIPGFDATRPWLAARPARPGCLLFRLLADNVEALPIDVRPGTPVVGLLHDAEGCVAGVRIQREESPLDIGATQAIILATGGFEASDAIKRQHLVSAPVLNGGFRGNTGDGIRFAQQAGADLWHMWHYHGPYGFRHPDPAYPFGIYPKLLPMWTPQRDTGPLPKMAWIIVDQTARRYADEYPPYLSDTAVRGFDYFDPHRFAHVRLPSFMILDERGRCAYPLGRSITNDRDAHYEWSADNLAEVGNGILHRAASIGELAKHLGLDPEVLQKTVGRWNCACAAGRDDEFGRRPETMMPVDEPPFYGAALWPVVINTQGGPVHDEHQRVLDPFGKPIPRLYAAGELGSLFGHVYMAGGNLAECLVGGRIAAHHALSLAAAARRARNIHFEGMPS